MQAATNFTSLLPVLTKTKLNALAAPIQQMKQAGIDASSYQQRFTAVQAQSAKVKTISDYNAFAQQIAIDEALMQTDVLKAQATTLIAQFHQEVTTWGNAHQYYDKYNGQSYPLDGGYMTKGIGEDLIAHSMLRRQQPITSK